MQISKYERNDEPNNPVHGIAHGGKDKLADQHEESQLSEQGLQRVHATALATGG